MIAVLVVALFLLSSKSGLGGGGGDACPEGRPPLTKFGSRLRDGRRVNPELKIQLPSTPRYFRLRFALEEDRGSWSLVVRNHTGRALNIFDRASFGPQHPDQRGRRVRWTDRIPGAFAQVDLITSGAEPAPVVRLDEYIVMDASAENTYYSSQDENNRRIRPLYEDDSLDHRRLGDMVGLLFAGRRGAMWACSAVAVAENVVLTNWHCGNLPDAAALDYWNQSICDATMIDFSWDGDERSREFACEEVLEASNPQLDLAFLRVRPIERPEALRPATLLDRAPGDEEVVLIHHPAGMPKQITRDCRAFGESTDVGPTRFAHKCDTETGSSGAPVFDRDGALLGLHHEGFERDPQTCRPLDALNKAIRSHAILEWLRRETTPGGAELLKAMNIRR
jgi:V8-like Glu-specific endopeptidase